MKALDDALKTLGVCRQQYFGGVLVGNHVHKSLQVKASFIDAGILMIYFILRNLALKLYAIQWLVLLKSTFHQFFMMSHLSQTHLK